MIIQNCNVNKLHDEFIKAGIIPNPVLDLDNGKGDFTFPSNADIQVIQAIINAHEPTPFPQPPTAEKRLEAVELALLELL